MSIDQLDLAVACGLTKRFGPAAEEVAAMTPWRRVAVVCLPMGQRWRLSALAADIKAFEAAAGSPS